jgi:hypothetical protein
VEWFRRSLRLRLRAVIVMGLFLSLSLAAAKVFEFAKESEGLHAALEVQKDFLAAVSAFQPLELGERYLGALLDPPVRAESPIGRDIWQKFLPPQTSPVVAEPRLAHWAVNFPWPLRPFVALVDVVWSLLTSWSPVHGVIILAELAVGFLASALLARGSGWYEQLLAVPLGTIVLGSLAAFATQIAMIFGLVVLGRIFDLAALCCGANVVGFFGYQLGVKYAEYRVDHAAHALVERIVPGREPPAGPTKGPEHS